MMIWSMFDAGHLTITESSKGYSIILSSLILQGDGEHDKTRELHEAIAVPHWL